MRMAKLSESSMKLFRICDIQNRVSLLLIINTLAFQIIKYLMMVKQLIENHEKIKEYIVNQIGLTCFLHLIEMYLPKFCSQQDEDSA